MFKQNIVININCYLPLKVAKESAKHIICDVGHAANVKVKLRALLTSEIVAVDEMTHEGLPTERSMDEQGTMISILD